ncbi:hypothetical protein QYM36_009214 [Artemia franciscana]|uniref:Uncharacterized protein n=1 Tax=Artemia franciscana TaxID=6661 RepID=A0AA88L557_ARTSF|nr:hypothetical protein QYM36_009214 [Artemia franciscana]
MLESFEELSASLGAILYLVLEIGQRKFFEYRALDGKTYSSTLHLEKFLNWTGLLIEFDPHLLLNILEMHRKAYAIRACVSPTATPMVKLVAPVKIIEGNIYTGYRKKHTKLDGYRSEKDDFHTEFKQSIAVECFPMYSLLIAANMTKIDLIVLQNYGNDLNIITSIPFDEILIFVFLIEVKNLSSDEKLALRLSMELKKYAFYDSISYQGSVFWLLIKNEFYTGKKDENILKKLTTTDIYKILTGFDDSSINYTEVDFFDQISRGFLIQ